MVHISWIDNSHGREVNWHPQKMTGSSQRQDTPEENLRIRSGFMNCERGLFGSRGKEMKANLHTCFYTF